MGQSFRCKVGTRFPGTFSLSCACCEAIYWLNCGKVSFGSLYKSVLDLFQNQDRKSVSSHIPCHYVGSSPADVGVHAMHVEDSIVLEDTMLQVNVSERQFQ